MYQRNKRATCFLEETEQNRKRNKHYCLYLTLKEYKHINFIIILISEHLDQDLFYLNFNSHWRSVFFPLYTHPEMIFDIWVQIKVMKFIWVKISSWNVSKCTYFQWQKPETGPFITKISEINTCLSFVVQFYTRRGQGWKIRSLLPFQDISDLIITHCEFNPFWNS